MSVNRSLIKISNNKGDIFLISNYIKIKLQKVEININICIIQKNI